MNIFLAKRLADERCIKTVQEADRSSLQLLPGVLRAQRGVVGRILWTARVAHHAARIQAWRGQQRRFTKRPQLGRNSREGEMGCTGVCCSLQAGSHSAATAPAPIGPTQAHGEALHFSPVHRHSPVDLTPQCPNGFRDMGMQKLIACVFFSASLRPAA